MTPTLQVTLEGRSASETKRTTQFNTATGAVTYDRTAEFDNFTPRAILRWRPSEDLTIYGIYSEGVKPGGLNGTAGLNVGKPEYLQETSINYEFGIKTQMFDRRLTMNFSTYFIEAENVQLTTAIPIGSALNSIATNQGNGEIKGLEFDVNWRAGGGLTLGGSYAWTVPEFTSGCDDDQWTLTSGGGLIAFIPPGSPAGTAPISTNPNGQGNCSIVGNRYPLTSEHQATINFDWRPGLTVAGGTFFASGDVSYESSKFVQVHNLAETGDATLVGGRFGLDGDNWQLSVYGRNLTDEDSIVIATRWLQTPYFTFISPTANTAASGFSRATPRAFFGSLRRGRAFGVELKYEF
jgi:iron complex outermembrane recepter protein